MINEQQSLDIQALYCAYREGRFSPADVIDLIFSRMENQPEHNVWITRLTRDQIQQYLDALQGKSINELPLYGVPFAIKDNIDLAGIPTTAACPGYAYTPEHNAFVVQRLIDAGAIPIGKTNLDQFATGLVGTRSPYGACENSFDPDYISGGSSAGSAVALATGLVSFSLGTDTAGSGRVPAAFNNLIGIKPTRGLLSTSGVVPACRSLDCVSIFSLNSADGTQVLDVAAAFDPQDAYARHGAPARRKWRPESFRFGVPQAEQLQFFGNPEAERLFAESVRRLEQMGGIKVVIDFEPFLEAARLLYEGPWVSERYVAIEDFITQRGDALFPVTRDIISTGADPSAADAFKSQYRLLELARRCMPTWRTVDFIVTPTAGTIYRIDEVNADPVRLNSNLGYYTNFMNLLDLSSLAVPGGFQRDGLPFGVSLIAPAFEDRLLLDVGAELHRRVGVAMGATGAALPEIISSDESDNGFNFEPGIKLAVCGAHLSGLALNSQLTDRDARLLQVTRTAEAYRLFALPGGPPARPGMVRDPEGSAIEVEVWQMPLDQFGSFMAGIPAPLGIGSVELADGEWVKGFICEGYGIEGAEELTSLGGWRAYASDQ